MRALNGSASKWCNKKQTQKCIQIQSALKCNKVYTALYTMHNVCTKLINVIWGDRLKSTTPLPSQWLTKRTWMSHERLWHKWTGLPDSALMECLAEEVWSPELSVGHTCERNDEIGELSSVLSKLVQFQSIETVSLRPLMSTVKYLSLLLTTR